MLLDVTFARTLSALCAVLLLLYVHIIDYFNMYLYVNVHQEKLVYYVL